MIRASLLSLAGTAATIKHNASSQRSGRRVVTVNPLRSAAMWCDVRTAERARQGRGESRATSRWDALDLLNSQLSSVLQLQGGSYQIFGSLDIRWKMLSNKSGTQITRPTPKQIILGYKFWRQRSAFPLNEKRSNGFHFFDIRHFILKFKQGIAAIYFPFEKHL